MDSLHDAFSNFIQPPNFPPILTELPSNTETRALLEKCTDLYFQLCRDTRSLNHELEELRRLATMQVAPAPAAVATPARPPRRAAADLIPPRGPAKMRTQKHAVEPKEHNTRAGKQRKLKTDMQEAAAVHVSVDVEWDSTED